MTEDKQKQKLKQKPTSKISNTYINKVDKKAATPYLIKKKKNGKVIAIKANKGKGAKRICYTILNQEEKEWKSDSNQGQQRKRGQMHLGAKGNYFNHEKHQEGLDLKGE
jgi:hypothetical protein